MATSPLSMRIFNDSLYTAICRVVHYCGFPFRELAEHLRLLVEQHGAKKVSEALFELCLHTNWRTMLKPETRKACWGLLGPPPEQWDEYYTTWDHQPLPRPPHHQTPPVIPPPEPDPFLDSLVRLVYTELEDTLKGARRRKALDEVKAIESEMVRRGLDLPVHEPEVLPLGPPEPPAEIRCAKAHSQEESVEAAMAGISAEGYAVEAKRKNKRTLLCMLRDARMKLAHHGKPSFMGKEAMKAIDAAQAELHSRGIEIPVEGQETAQWDRKKK